MKNFPPEKAFSLIELIVTIGIIVLLASLVFPALSRTKEAGDRVDSIDSMRRMGVLIVTYIADHDGFLPGPLNNGQYAVMKRESQQFSWVLRDYLDGGGSVENQVIRELGYKRFFREANPVDQVSLANNSGVLMDEKGTRANPWGKNAQPLKHQKIYQPSRQVGIMQADAKLTNYLGVVITSAAPAEPYFESGRVALFFDWHAETMPISYTLGTFPYKRP